MATKTDVEEFTRILQYFKEGGEYPGDSKPKILVAVKQFQEDEARLKEKIAEKNTKKK
jgi:hypothetical protein